MGAVKAGICLRIPDVPEDKYQRHLYVVLNDPDDREPQGIAVVRFRTFQPGMEETLILKEGHPFIDRPTCVEYIKAKVISVAKVEARIKVERRFRHETDCSSELLDKIKSGILQSDFVRPIVQNYCREEFAKAEAKARAVPKRDA